MSGVPNPNPDRARRAQATTLQAMLGLQPATTALALAAALDPEYLETVGSLDQATQDGVLAVIERMCLRDVIFISDDHEHAISTLTVQSPEVVARVAQAEQEFATYQAREGVFSRPTVLMNAKTMEPAKWWSMYGRHLPLLSSIASRVLAQPGAASWAERNWSRA